MNRLKQRLCGPDRRYGRLVLLVALACALLVAFPAPGLAQDEPEVVDAALDAMEDAAAEEAPETQLGDKTDNTGTNPINFSNDLRFYNEYSWLNTLGDGAQSVMTVEYRTAFANGKWQWRIRARPVAGLEADLNDDGVDDIDQWGFGDTDMRFFTVPYIDMAKAQAIGLGMELFFDTATEGVLGTGNNTIGPQIFYGKFFRRGLFAPGLQYRYSVDEDDGRAKTRQWAIDLNLLIMAKDRLSWFFTNPQTIIDTETDQEFAIFDLEFGWMMAKFGFNAPGQSFYIRPAFGVGGDRPVDYAIEVGYKIVGF